MVDDIGHAVLQRRVARWVSLPLAAVDRKARNRKGVAAQCRVEKPMVGLTAIGRLDGDGLSVPGTGTFSRTVRSPLSRFIART